MIKRTAGLAVVAVVAIATLLGITAAPALASSYNTGGTTTSITNFTTGSTTYTQDHAGDDIAFDVTSGPAIDMRWVKCSDSSVHGSINYNIGTDGYRVLGTDFKATTCLHLQFRGFTSTGAFRGVTYWDYNFA
ncbi:hypothetical protein ACWT_0869 [Actinoplanes sp. SE50]|uniref:hypothetical protein n=1 Tax=unclassified Actinoplanes TaxID=2626549 RepID=UPI00023EC203|nr:MULTISPECIES: hypothetical protein [unclassified Actinoplanes]AEV81883.1 hypothetical protein ACPL_986 [Actinoplanes sp. SE50/110]ATO80284.1 hypothetical protein ACWT_0869 [Actinoplanes sp. SE50]SLL97689.1 hypothetical protein ACSP50_0898 [Actinoplanes sp. SE50/110]